MYKLCSMAVVGLALAGCASAPPDTTRIVTSPAATAATHSGAAASAIAAASVASSAATTPIAVAIVNATPQPSSVPVKALNMADFKDDGTRCEELTRPGSRIIVARRCRPIVQDEDAAFDDGVLADQLNQVRRDRDEVNQARREQNEVDQSAPAKQGRGREGQ